MRTPTRKRLVHVLAAAALAVTSMVFTAGSVGAATGCFAHTTTFFTAVIGGQMSVWDDINSQHDYKSEWKITVKYCVDNSGTHSNGLPTYALVSGWGWPTSVQ